MITEKEKSLYEEMLHVLEGYDQDLRPLDDTMIREDFTKLIPAGNYQASYREKAEWMAITLAEKFNPDEQQWGYGIYFGPRACVGTKDGNEIFSPALEEITREMIDYWKARATEAKHPYLVARYAGLAWEFGPMVIKEKPVHGLRKSFLQSMLSLVSKRLFGQAQAGILHLKRAMHMVTAYNDKEFYPVVRGLILDLQQEYLDKNVPGGWRFGFDMLFKNSRLAASAAEIKGLVQILEKKLMENSQPNAESRTDPWATREAATRLAIYYKSLGQEEEVRRVILQVGKAFEPLLVNNASFQVAGWLQQLYELYREYALPDAESVLLRLREVSKKSVEEMGLFDYKFNVPKNKIDELVAYTYKGGRDLVFQKIINRFIPNKSQTKEKLLEMGRETPLRSYGSKVLQDKNGRVVATVASIDDDLEGNIILSISEQFPFSALFLHHVLEEGIKNEFLTKASLINFFSQSAVIRPERMIVFEKGIDAYLSGEYLVFIHLVIPQFEEAVRNLVEINGGNILRFRNKAYQLRTFDDILRDPLVQEVFEEDLLTYFRVLFTDARGWNLRNEVCHGMVDPVLLNRTACDRVLHALLCLGMIRLMHTVKK